MKRQTPRTDEFIAKFVKINLPGEVSIDAVASIRELFVVYAEFARQLETELSAALERVREVERLATVMEKERDSWRDQFTTAVGQRNEAEATLSAAEAGLPPYPEVIDISDDDGNNDDAEMQAVNKYDYDALRAYAIALGARVAEWQPIETAPKDGTWVMVLCAKSIQDSDLPEPCVFTDRWVSETNEWWEQVSENKKVKRLDDNSHWISYEDPTHWQPLPPRA